MARERFWHWVGTLVNLKVYAETREEKRRREMERKSITKVELSPSTTVTCLRLDGEECDVEMGGGPGEGNLLT